MFIIIKIAYDTSSKTINNDFHLIKFKKLYIYNAIRGAGIISFTVNMIVLHSQSI